MLGLVCLVWFVFIFFFPNIAVYSMNIKGTQVAVTVRCKNSLHALLMLLLQAFAECSTLPLK